MSHVERISVRLTTQDQKTLDDLRIILSSQKGLNLSQSDVIRYALKELKKNL